MRISSVRGSILTGAPGQPASNGHPAQQLRVYLESERAEGADFEEAWDLAVSRIVWPTDGPTRKEWRQAVADTRPTWEKCYRQEGPPLTIEMIVRALSEAGHGSFDEDL